MNASPTERYEIAGAGPAGLATAITLARAGAHVVVHEAADCVGHRFKRDLQGLENWTTPHDVLKDMQMLGLTTDFSYVPCRQGQVFDAWGKSYHMQSLHPIFYLVERGPGEGSLDTALLQQALSLGVEVRFNSKLTTLVGDGVLATGPRATDAIAVGYHFDTEMKNGFWVICDDKLAPEGYAYLLVMNGKGTVKTCMFADLKNSQQYVKRTVDAFEQLVHLKMDNPVQHGGVGNLRIPNSAISGRHPVVGEQAGFQDSLWGFGMRYAMASGVIAAECLLKNKDYDLRWRQEFGPLLRNSLVNRTLFKYMGNRGYRWFLSYAQRQLDVRTFLHDYYKPSLLKNLFSPLLHWHYKSLRQKQYCQKIDCTCVWCKCS